MEQTEHIDANQVADSSDATSMLSSPDYVGGNADSATPAVDAGATDTDDKKGAADADASKTGTDDKGGKNLEDRFDKHPRFQELESTVKSEREARIKAEAKIAMYEKSPLSSQFLPDDSEIPTNEKGEPLFKDITKMAPAEVREWQEDDPIGFAKNLQDMTLHQIKVQANRNQANAMQKATFEGIAKTFDDYAAKHPDFNTMWDSGEIEKYMNANPGINAISAHMILTEDARIKAIVEEVTAKVSKETEERVTKNFQAKRNATVIDSAKPPREAVDGVDPALQDTNKFGGRNSVLANRLAAMRRGAAAQ